MARILILEDEVNTGQALALMVEHLGHTVVGVAPTGAEALALVASCAPDLALVDIILPGEMDGVEVARALQERDIPVVFLTSHSKEEVVERAKFAEPYGFLLKPVHPRQLAAVLSVALFKAVAARASLNRNCLYATLFSFCEAVLATDDVGKIVLVNKAALKLLEANEVDLLGCRLTECFDLRDKISGERVMPTLLAGLDQEGSVRRENLSLITPAGSTVDVSVGISRSYAGDGRYIGDAVLILDMTEHNRLLSQLYKLSSAAEQTADAVMITTPEGEIEYVNRAFEQVTGYTRADLVGAQPSILRSGYHDDSFYQRLWNTVKNGETFRDVFVNRKKDGVVYYEEKTITPLRSEQGEITHFLSVGSDITQRLQTEERLLYLSTHDIQTDLPNRALLHDRLDQALAITLKAGRTLGVLLLGIDRFKVVNETLGHSAGDVCLKTLAQRIKQTLRPGDTVARFGGDVFALLLDDVATVDDIARITRHLLQVVSLPVSLPGQAVVLTASVGISSAPQDFSTREDLLRSAEAALDRAKSDSGNRYQFFTPDMNARARLRFSLEAALRGALEREEFLLYYQPIVNLSDGEIAGFEALLRWQSPEFGFMLPDSFIPLLEETGLIIPVGAWVMEQACHQQTEWEKQTGRPLTMAVNFSILQLQIPDLAHKIADCLRIGGMPAQRLYLEVTESLLMKHVERSSEILREIAALGVNIAIDDFGTGYSSLSYLTQLPVNTLKVDRAFMRDVPRNIHNVKVAQGIVALGLSLGLRTVGEGVETVEQEAFLRELNCAYAQGYLFGKPMPAAECLALIAKSMSAVS